MRTEIIGIDHGNGNMKTAHTVFPCGFKMQEREPSALFAKDIVEYEGLFYSLTPNRFSYQVDKTTDERCYVLTLFAVAKELMERNDKLDEDGMTRERGTIEADVVLAVGLPPAHFEKQHGAFQRYFEERAGDGMNFAYNGKRFRLRVVGVTVYPQDFAAAIVYREDIVAKYRTVFCIDIGDGTVDMLALSGGMPDKDTMVSRELGMSHLREQIIDDVINDYGMTLDGMTIDDVLSGRDVVIPGQVMERIQSTTEEFALRIVNQLHSKVPDFRIAPTIFCGGGAALLKPYLEKSGQFGMMDFIDEIHANAVGYERIAEMTMGKG
ncbi:MAG: ParM/StbA family protein [Lachnospiraceae bacterium]|nr:ParM/StbA family protein [Lachnospiraceae bacterium]